MSSLIRPRLTDYHGIHVAQVDLDFAIPFFEEDIPLYVDPFLLWRSPSLQDQSLHTGLINAFNNLGHLNNKGKEDEAVRQIIMASECDEVGLGVSKDRRGARIGERTARSILRLFKDVPNYNQNGFRHFEEIQLFVDGISKDRVSDIACNFLKSFLIDYTIDQCDQLGIPTREIAQSVYIYNRYDFAEQTVRLPFGPEDLRPIIFVPKRWLRHVPWINFDEYFKKYCPQDDVSHEGETLERVQVLKFNRENYGVIESYVREKERELADCHEDPLFKQVPVVSAQRKLSELLKLPSGTEKKAHLRYEKFVGQLLPSLLYPHLDFAAEQSRVISGTSIRDVIFYNGRNHPFLSELYNDYGSKQITFELKNVSSIESEHIDQLNRYMTVDLGKFGVLVTRKEPRKARQRQIVDLWSGQRKAIIVITDEDLAQMVQLFESKQRLPVDVLKKKYVEFQRACPV